MFHSSWTRYLAGVLTVVLATFVFQHSVATAQVSKKHLKELEANFLPAWRIGDNFSVLKSLSKVVQKMSDDEIVELDKLLASDEIPEAAQVLVESRLNLLQQGITKGLPRPKLRDLLMTLDCIDREVSDVLEEAATLEAELAKADKKESFDIYKEKFWDIHVLQQKLRASAKLTEYAAYVLKGKKRYLKKDLEPEQTERLNKDYVELGKQLSEAFELLGERETMVRIERLKFSNETLADSEILKDRYLATFALDMDGRLLTATLATEKVDFQIEELNDLELLPTIKEQVESGKELAGDELITKSGLLFTGLHWWKRGRYGMGTEGYGFLKSQAALTSNAAMFPLYMPEETPDPTSRYSERSVPEVDRRHNYIWNWEYRKLTYSSRKATTGKILAH